MQEDVNMPVLPAGFVENMTKVLGADEAKALTDALDTEASVSVRINRSKPCRLPESLTGEAVAWCPDGMILNQRPAFTFIPQLHSGGFYVQDSSSMIIGTVVSRLMQRMDTDNPVYLDACAAPGGKSIAALSTLGNDALVVANEYDRRRAQILVENLAKWGAPNVVVTNCDTAEFRQFSDTFDIVGIDAPCSGEGMMRKEAEARRQWSAGLVEQCSRLQLEIIDNLWPTLKPGGFLIYSTCTFNTTENEGVARHIIDRYGAEMVDLRLAEEFGLRDSVDDTVKGARFMPHITPGEGLFLCVLRKPGDTAEATVSENRRKDRRKKPKKEDKCPAELPAMISTPEDYKFRLMADGAWHALPSLHDGLISRIAERVHTLSAGVEVACLKGKDIVPAHQLALSTILNNEAFPQVELTEEEALQYLRREAITLPPDTPRGYVIVTRCNLPLGFVKNIGNRCNNLYPQNWRIRSQG